MIFKIASKFYGSIVSRRNKFFDGSSELVKAGVPVFSVGNISVGGSGKTPFSIFLAKYLISEGHRPAVIGRAYKAKANYDLVVSDGKNIFASPDTAGDEMFLIATKLYAPVVVSKHKFRAAQIAKDRFNIDCIIVDDGFQHRKLHRDLDIALIDSDTVNNPKLLPQGRLREPLTSLQRAGFICLPEYLELDLSFKKYINEDAGIAKFKINAGMPYMLNEPSIKLENPFSALSGGCIQVCGIAKPANFQKLLKTLNVSIKASVIFPDHHNYDWEDLDKVLKKCHETGVYNIAVTEKDAVKLNKYVNELNKHDLKVYVFPIELEIFEGMEYLRSKVQSVFLNYKL